MLRRDATRIQTEIIDWRGRELAGSWPFCFGMIEKIF